MIGSDRLGETDHSHHCYVCQCLRENTIITLKWWIWGRIYMKFSIQMPDVPSKNSENPSLPAWLQKIRYSRSAFARQSQRGVGPPSRCWGQWVGFWLNMSSERHKDDERWWKKMKDFWYWCFEYVGCATDVLKTFYLILLQILQLVAGNGDWKSMFPGPREQLPLLCRRRKEVTGASSSVDFLCQISHIYQLIMWFVRISNPP